MNKTHRPRSLKNHPVLLFICAVLITIALFSYAYSGSCGCGGDLSCYNTYNNNSKSYWTGDRAATLKTALANGSVKWTATSDEYSGCSWSTNTIYISYTASESGWGENLVHARHEYIHSTQTYTTDPITKYDQEYAAWNDMVSTADEIAWSNMSSTLKSTLETYDDLNKCNKIQALYGTYKNDSRYTLTAEQKNELYSKYGCL